MASDNGPMTTDIFVPADEVGVQMVLNVEDGNFPQFGQAHEE